MRKQIAIVVNNIQWCSGSCGFCNAAQDIGYIQGINQQKLVESLEDIDNRTYQEAKWDFDALEKKLLNWPFFKKENGLDVGLWGGDPLTSFQCLQECIDFLDYFKKKYCSNLVVHFSTNGLALARPEIVEYIYKHTDIIRSFQLSHDGLSNYFRCGDLNPLEWDSTKALLKDRILSCICCILNFWNSSPLKNFEYFESIVDHDVHQNKVGYRLYSIRDGHYDDRTINQKGLLNGQEYEALKGLPLGDYMIRNDIELAEKTGVFQLAHQADDFFHEMQMIYTSFNNDKWAPLRSVFTQRAQYNLRVMDRESPKDRYTCSNFHHGLIDYSDCIDTTGRYTDCHLMDADTHVPNPEWKRPDYCESCKYNTSFECNQCGSTEPNKKLCDFQYRIAQLYESVNRSPNLKKWISVYNGLRRGECSFPRKSADLEKEYQKIKGKRYAVK